MVSIDLQKLKLDKYNTIIAVVAIVVPTVAAWIGTSYQLSKTHEYWKTQQTAIYELKANEAKLKQIEQIITLSNEMLSEMHTSSAVFQHFIMQSAYIVATNAKGYDAQMDALFNRHFEIIQKVKSKKIQLTSRLSTLKSLFSEDVQDKAGELVAILEKVGYRHPDYVDVISFISVERKKNKTDKEIYDQLVERYSSNAIGFSWYDQNLVELINLMYSETKNSNISINSD